MKKFFKILFLFLTIITISVSTKAEKGPVGIWKFESENGSYFPGVTNIVKIVNKDGTFQVLWSYNYGQSYIVKQSGTWEKISKGVILEKPTMGNTSEVILYYEIKKGALQLTFSYPSEPNKLRVQTYAKIKSLTNKETFNR